MTCNCTVQSGGMRGICRRHRKGAIVPRQKQRRDPRSIPKTLWKIAVREVFRAPCQTTDEACTAVTVVSREHGMWRQDAIAASDMTGCRLRKMTWGPIR
jgi:hypothetical protein